MRDTDISHTYVCPSVGEEQRWTDTQTSDVGEAFRPVVPPAVVTAAYGVSWLYLAG